MVKQSLRFMGLSAIAAVFLATPGLATVVSYNTSGVFSDCSNGFTCSGNTLTGGGMTIKYTNVPNGNVSAPPPTNAGYGHFTVTGLTSTVQTVSFMFTLDINQSTASESFSTTDTSQTISNTGSTLALDFTPGNSSGPAASVVSTFNPLSLTTPALEFELNGDIFYLDSTNPINKTNPSTINGAITATPEPGLYAIVFSGLMVIGLAGARRRRKDSAA